MENPSPSALLTFVLLNMPPHRVEERLHVYPDGRLTLLSPAAAAAARRSQAGSFATPPDAQLAAQAAQLARDLIDLAPTGDPDDRGGIQMDVVVGLDGRQTVHALTGGQLPPALELARRQFETWLALAEQAPFAVAQISARRQGDAAQARVVLTCTTSGQQPVALLLSPESLEIRHADGQTVWRSAGKLSVGLVGADGRLVDGLRVPARMAPGSRAALSFQPGKTLPAQSLLLLEGYLTLYLPGEAMPEFPRERFAMQCRLAE